MMVSKKGILDIEFILSVFVFVTTVSFVVIMVVIGNIPGLQQLSISEDLRSRNFQITENLIFSQGYPENWVEGNVTSLGLSSGDYYRMSLGKINNMSSLCQNNYQRVKDLLGLGYQNDVYINISYIDGEDLVMCNPGVTKRSESEIYRIGMVGNRPARVVVSLT